jgi:hypothetical protein
VTEVTVHPGPRWRDVVLEQIRIVGLSLGPAALILAVVLGTGTVLIVGEIAGGGPGFDVDETFPTALIAFLYPFAVWRNEPRFGPAFLWTFPVDRRRLALAKVFAGLVWLMVGIALFVTWLFALGLLAGAPAARTVARVPLVATFAMYLFGSALVLGLRHPLRWLVGGAGVVVLMGTLSDLFTQPNDGEWAYVPGAGAFFSMATRFMEAWLSLPESVQSVISTLFVFGAGFAALWMAASRHRDRRKQTR